METDLKFRPFRSPADPGWDEAWAIYQNSFPQKEIRSLEDHLQALSDPHYTADGIWSDGRLIGILYYWTAPEYVYIEHLAISPDLRGANMGSRVLEAFCRKAGRIVLEIDPPETGIAARKSPSAASDFPSGWGSCATITIMSIRRSSVLMSRTSWY